MISIKYRCLLFLLLMGLYSCGSNSGSDEDTKSIDLATELSNFFTSNPNFPSITLTVIKDGQIIFMQGEGFRDASRSKPADENTLYFSSSVSKLVVGTAIMQQVEQGNLDLDADISTYLGFQLRNPSFPNQIITARMLAQHSASLSNPVLGEAIDDVFFVLAADSVVSLHPTIENIFTVGHQQYRSGIWLSSPPGILNKNSNMGMTLLAYTVERLSGMHLIDYAKTNIFQPLGMDATSFYYPDLDANNIADLRDSNGNVFQPFNLFFYPAGMMHTSGVDWSKFMNAILNGGELNGNRILQQASVDDMLNTVTPSNNQLAYNSNIGIIWREAQANPGWIGHTGGGGTITHISELNPDEGIGYVMFTNLGAQGNLIGPGSNLNGIIHNWLQQQIDKD